MSDGGQPASPDAAIVRLRVSYKGGFFQDAGASWRYLGGDHFLESTPDTARYADLMFSLAEKVDGAVSVKYQLPGEELDPDSLISVSDDNDVKELFHEYWRAMRMPGTPIKTFRLRLFLFPASEDPYTPEDLAYFTASHASSGDKLGREVAAAAAAAAAAGLAPLGPGPSGSGKEGSLARAFAKAASQSRTSGHARTPSSFSSELSVSSAQDGGTGGSPDGTATPSAADTELAWEAGFRAGQEAAVLAAQDEWEGLVTNRMTYLGHVQSDYILSAADAALGAAHWPEDLSHPTSPWDPPHSVHLGGGAGYSGSGVAAGGAPHDFGALDDIDYDPDAEEAAEAAEEAAALVRLEAVAVASQPPSLAASRQPSPRAPTLAAAAPPPPLPASALLHHPQPHAANVAPGTLQRGAPRPLRPSSALLDSPLARQTSGVMEDMENDVEFQSMFESKYDTGAVASLAPPRRSPSVPLAASASTPHTHGSAGGSGSASGSASRMAANAGGGSSLLLSGMADVLPTPATAAVPIKQRSRAHGSRGGHVSAGGAPEPAAISASPNSLLPTHISVFGDGVTGLDLQHAAVASRPAVQLPSHISEFGGEDGEARVEDADLLSCHDRDANTMSVMKAALPDDDDLLADAVEALRRAPLPPDAVQLPTSFELLGGGGSDRGAAGGAAGASPRMMSPRLEGPGGGLGPAGGGMGEAVGAGALPHQPGELKRSPSLEELLSKVQRIDASQVNVLAKIGEGAFGEVSLAQCPTYGRVAVKWIKPTKVERHWASFWHEAELMSRLNHPNVLRFFGLVVEGPMVVGIMTEFAAAGSLASYLRSGVGFIPLRQRAQLALHAVNGMAYLHSLKVVHFDVKPDNLLVDGDWMSERGPMVKVADFGLSKHKYNTFCSNVHDLRGTLPYMAPEMIMDHTHVTEKADVWSLGVVFWEMLTLEVPFADMPPAQLIGALGLGRLRLTIPEWCEPDWRALMESCWVEDPALRPSCRQLATHLERIRDMAP